MRFVLFCFIVTTRSAESELWQIGKLTDPDSIDLSREQFDLFSPLPGRDTLSIDTGVVTPDDSAEMIIGYFGLEKI